MFVVEIQGTKKRISPNGRKIEKENLRITDKFLNNIVSQTDQHTDDRASVDDNIDISSKACRTLNRRDPLEDNKTAFYSWSGKIKTDRFARTTIAFERSCYT